MKLTFEVDELDAKAINEAIVEYQRESHAAFGEVIVAEGDSSQGGAILAEICRSWQEYRATWQPPRDPEDDAGEEWKKGPKA